MEINQKRYLRAVLVIVMTALLSMKLPHIDKSFFQIIIPPIKTSPSSRLYLSGLLTVLPLLWGYKEIVKSNYFNKDKIVIFILMFFIIVPILFKGINIVKTPYYALNRGLRTIEIVDSKFNFEFDNNTDKINIEMHLRNYSNDMKNFNISLEVPDSLKEIISNDILVLSSRYSIGPYRDEVYIEEIIEFNYADGFSQEDIFDSYYDYDSYKIILFNGKYELVVTQSGDF